MDGMDEDERLTDRSGVHARPLFELISDTKCDEEDDHSDCLNTWVAATWPEPHQVGHRIGDDKERSHV